MDRKKAVGVRLADGRVFRGKAVISNATRWDTFEKLISEERLPPSEKAFRSRYKKSPSFISIHMGVRKSAIPAGNAAYEIIIYSRSLTYTPVVISAVPVSQVDFTACIRHFQGLASNYVCMHFLETWLHRKLSYI